MALNAALALVVAGAAADIADGMEPGAHARIASGAARAALDALRGRTRRKEVAT